jgi:Tol biopolymer transport system component
VALIGQTLSHYRITARLGAGGMGEVYRATDTTLRRDVAIKVLPAEVAQDPERLARFRREAQLLSQLNHPNVAAIYGLEEAGAQSFLALELVEGEDLKERLARGAVPVDEALEIAVQIAEAVEEAHHKGIIHRDLKPANVKVTPEGRVKVLDFGLAKAWGGDPAEGGSGVTDSPTLTRAGTLAGVILGTAGYMSPEQARGKAVDRRADVWSFGVLLWEMLAGKVLFDGDTVTDVIAAVVTKDPDLDALPPATPRPVRRLIERCLRKDPRTRLPDIGAARLELQDVRAGRAGDHDALPDAEIARAARRSHGRERWIWAALTLVALGVAGVLAFMRLTEVPAGPPPAAHFVVQPPEGGSFSTDWLWPAVSPDGRQLVVRVVGGSAPSQPQSMLWMRALDSPALRPLVGTEGAGDIVFWSPDSRAVAFFAAPGGELRKLTLADGSVQRICALPAQGIGGADWSRDGTILFSTGAEKGRIYAVAAAGGEAKVLLEADESRGEIRAHGPHLLPDGRHFLFTVSSDREDVRGVYVASLDAPRTKRRVLPFDVRARYTAGHLLFVRDGTLVAQPFDPRRAEVAGEPSTVVSSVGSWRLGPGWGWFGTSPNGTLAYFSGETVAGQLQLTWVDRRGTKLATVGEPGSYGQIALSPDERNVALEVRDDKGEYDLWVMDVARGVASRVTTRPGNDRDPVWWPDGRSLVFAAMGVEKGALRRKGLRAGDPEAVLTEFPDEDHPEYLLRDGKTLLFVRRTPEDAQSLWALSLADGKAAPVFDGRFRVDEPQLSPDERWLAYVSHESGRDEVYVEPFRREGERVRVSFDGGGQPKWRHDGKELFFLAMDNKVMAVDVRVAGARLEVGLPAALFDAQGIEGTGYDDYAPSADGQRFLVKMSAGKDQRPQLHVVTNWPSLLDTKR